MSRCDNRGEQTLFPHDTISHCSRLLRMMTRFAGKGSRGGWNALLQAQSPVTAPQENPAQPHFPHPSPLLKVALISTPPGCIGIVPAWRRPPGTGGDATQLRRGDGTVESLRVLRRWDWKEYPNRARRWAGLHLSHHDVFLFLEGRILSWFVEPITGFPLSSRRAATGPIRIFALKFHIPAVGLSRAGRASEVFVGLQSGSATRACGSPPRSHILRGLREDRRNYHWRRMVFPGTTRGRCPVCLIDGFCRPPD